MLRSRSAATRRSFISPGNFSIALSMADVAAAPAPRCQSSSVSNDVQRDVGWPRFEGCRDFHFRVAVRPANSSARPRCANNCGESHAALSRASNSASASCARPSCSSKMARSKRRVRDPGSIISAESSASRASSKPLRICLSSRDYTPRLDGGGLVHDRGHHRHSLLRASRCGTRNNELQAILVGGVRHDRAAFL